MLLHRRGERVVPVDQQVRPAGRRSLRPPAREADRRAAGVVGSPDKVRAAIAAQSRALVVLQNTRGPAMLPRRAARLFVVGVDTAVARAYGYRVVGRAEDADVALVRVAAPFQQLPALVYQKRIADVIRCLDVVTQ